jgi:tetratricopeptide (TPR) repeat protein
MRNTLFAGWILASISCFGRPQEPEKMCTPAEMNAALEADLHGRAEVMYGSDLSALRNALVNGTPADKNRAIREALHLPDPPRPPVISGTVSAAALRHAVPKAAAKAHERARKLVASGKFSDAAPQLEKALGLDPDFAEAHENLGALYLKLGRPAEAEPHIRRAIELNPSSSFAHSDLSAVQLLAGDLAGAERSARRALQLSAGNDWARFVLGEILVVNPATYSEGLQHLEYASRSVPAARDTLRALQAR